MELENEGSIPFLDVLIKRGVVTQVYRKLMHTNRYLNFKSNHHPRIKAGIVKCLTHRAKEVCHPSMLQPELDHIHEVFQDNDYPKQLVRRYIKQQSHKKLGVDDEKSEEDTTTLFCLPYVKGLSESIERSCKQLDIKFAFKSRRTLRQLLTRVKNPIPPEKKGVIYKVNCGCGNTYIGEMGRTLDEVERTPESSEGQQQ